MRSILRRFGLGLGAMLVVAGCGLFLLGHEAVRMLISFAVEDPAARDKVFGLLGGGVFLATIGTGLLVASMPRTRESPRA